MLFAVRPLPVSAKKTPAVDKTGPVYPRTPKLNVDKAFYGVHPDRIKKRPLTRKLSLTSLSTLNPGGRGGIRIVYLFMPSGVFFAVTGIR